MKTGDKGTFRHEIIYQKGNLAEAGGLCFCEYFPLPACAVARDRVEGILMRVRIQVKISAIFCTMASDDRGENERAHTNGETSLSGKNEMKKNNDKDLKNEVFLCI